MILSKQPWERPSFTFDFSADLGAATIASVDAVEITKRGPAADATPLVKGAQSVTSTAVIVRLDDGTDGLVYDIIVKIIASDGQRLALTGAVEVRALPGDPTDLSTPAGLKAAFPSFDAVPDATVRYWIARAARTVDTSWASGDRDHARALLACHLMTEQGLGAGFEAESAAAGTAGLKRMKSGSLEIERADIATGGLYGATAYGRQFAVLLRANKGGPRLTGLTF